MKAKKAHRKTCTFIGYWMVLPKGNPSLIGCLSLPSWLCLRHLEALTSQMLPIFSVERVWSSPLPSQYKQVQNTETTCHLGLLWGSAPSPLAGCLQSTRSSGLLLWLKEAERNACRSWLRSPFPEAQCLWAPFRLCAPLLGWLWICSFKAQTSKEVAGTDGSLLQWTMVQSMALDISVYLKGDKCGYSMYL